MHFGTPDNVNKRLKKDVAYEVYDFRRPDKFSRDQLRTLQMVHETFARLCTTNLSAYLRTQIHVELISIEQVPFEEYTRNLTHSVFMIFNTPPLSGQSVIEMEFPLMFALLDRLLGGTGRIIERNSLTEIERPLALTLAERTMAALKSAWESILHLDPQIEVIETNVQFMQIAPPTDIVITALMEARIGDQRGAMSLCIPHLVVKPITPKLSSQKWIASAGKRASAHNKQIIGGQLCNTHVECVVQLGTAHLKLERLINLKPGDLITLDTETSGKVDILLHGRCKFQGRPAIKNEHLVVSITDIVTED